MPSDEGLGWLPDLPVTWRITDPRPQDIDYINRRWRETQERMNQVEPISRGEIEAESDRINNMTRIQIIELKEKIEHLEGVIRHEKHIRILIFTIIIVQLIIAINQ